MWCISSNSVYSVNLCSTDINNAASIQSTLATIATDETVAKNLGDAPVYIRWSEHGSLGDETDEPKKTIVTKLNSLLTDGFPESKSNNTFEIAISKKSDGSISATCKIYKTSTTNGQPAFNAASVKTENITELEAD